MKSNAPEVDMSTAVFELLAAIPAKAALEELFQ